MSAVLVPVLVLVVLALVAMAAVRVLRRRDEAVKAEAFSPNTDTLRYHVPEGQDPAAVIAALEVEGYRATLAPAPSIDDVLIPCRAGAERERAHVRAVIAHSALNMEGDPGDHPVVFIDEPREGI
ncbi:hypothetical protein SAMN04487968_101555 [Nocardioides terrae]|uniref:Uncharacterized protein n=1 Tax=Nocardioides terrae TaxID=574651 RepID=A0A1I1DZ11_9ACTN|nr:hypothetical protein [Nocardioides terrae]SFB79666.1 hypothetical protein SAMN04487968_101555 [Nocardioides terrae]